MNLVEAIVNLGRPCLNLSHQEVEKILNKLPYSITLNTSHEEAMKITGSLREVRENIGFNGPDNTSFSKTVDKLIIAWLQRKEGV